MFPFFISTSYLFFFSIFFFFNDTATTEIYTLSLHDALPICTWPPLVTFGSQLAAELGHPVQVNAYVTPPQNQGFAPHYDVHDVFVLQVAGRKRWRVHEPVLADPLGDQPWEQRRGAVAAQASEAPVLDELLEPGDALYLPRG